MMLLVVLTSIPMLYSQWFFDHLAFPVMIFTFLCLATFGPSTMYLFSQRVLYPDWKKRIKYLPFLMSVGVGISFNNARAALEGFLGQQSEFVRTPKFGIADSGDTTWRSKNGRQGIDRKTKQALVELAMACYMAVCVWYTVTMRLWVGLFFMCLFAAGYFYVAILSLAAQWQTAAAGPATAIEPAPRKLRHDS